MGEFTLLTFTISNSYKHINVHWNISLNSMDSLFCSFFLIKYFYFCTEWFASSFFFLSSLWQISQTVQSEADVCLNAFAQRRLSNVYYCCSCFSESTKGLMKDFADKVKKNEALSKWHCNNIFFISFFLLFNQYSHFTHSCFLLLSLSSFSFLFFPFIAKAFN